MIALRSVALAAAVVAFAGCVKPDPPKITPQSAKVTSISNVGIELDVSFVAENPNSFDLSANSFTAKLTLDEHISVGTVVIAKPFSLPSKKKIEMHVPVSMKWSNLLALVPLAQKASVPYAVDGTVQIGGALSIDVPFHIVGTLTREQMVKVMASAVPKIPGLPF